MRERLALAALALVVLATRLPFLGPGFGLDPDAWRLALAAERIAETGAYAYSRPPGYPVVELGAALLARGGPPALNGASALACVVASLFVAALARRLRPGAASPAGLAFAFAPVVYVASVSSMDYLWAAALLLGALIAAGKSRPLLAGLALGLAIGARPSSALMLAPLAWIFARGPRGWRGALGAGALAAVVAALAYAPVLAAYPLARLAPTRAGRPELATLFARAGPGTLGALGSLACALALGLPALRGRARSEREGEPADARALRQALALGLSLSLALFLLLPLEAGYLIPALALGLPLLAAALTAPAAWILAGLVALGSFVEPRAGALASPSAWGRGPILRDHDERLAREARLPSLVAAARALPAPAVVIVGPWLPRIAYELRREPPSGVAFVFLVTPRDAALAREYGRALHHLPELDVWHAAVSGHAPAELGSRPLGETPTSLPPPRSGI